MKFILKLKLKCFEDLVEHEEEEVGIGVGYEERELGRLAVEAATL